MLHRLAADLPRVWAAPTTTDRDRKELLRALLADVVLSVDRERDHGGGELWWQGGARSELSVKLNRTGPKRTDTSEDLVELIRRLAQHSADPEIAMVLVKQGRLTPTGLPFTAARVAGVRQRAGIPAAQPRARSGARASINEAARRLGVCTQTIRRWLAEGLLPAEQTAPHAPWRIRLSEEVRRRFVPEVPDGYVPLAEAARRLGLARPTVLNQVCAGERRAIQVTQGKRRGLRIELGDAEQGLLGPGQGEKCA